MSLGTCTDFTTELVCYDDGAGNKQTLVAHYEYGKSAIGSTILVSTRFTVPDGTVVDTSAGTVTMGACPVVPVQRTINHEAQNFAAGTFAASHDPLGNGAAWVYPGAGLLQSVTVTVLEAGTPGSGNSVQIKQGAAGTVVHMVKGQTLTWSVAQDTMNEVLDPSFDINALGNSAFVVSWTEEL
jgi:hypothetical protein